MMLGNAEKHLEGQNQESRMHPERGCSFLGKKKGNTFPQYLFFFLYVLKLSECKTFFVIHEFKKL